MQEQRYTNEMIDRLMSVIVPSFCYRDVEVKITTQRLGFVQLGENESFELWYMFDDGLEFYVSGDDLDSVGEVKEHKMELMSKFNELIRVAIEEFGLEVFRVDYDENEILLCYIDQKDKRDEQDE